MIGWKQKFHRELGESQPEYLGFILVLVIVISRIEFEDNDNQLQDWFRKMMYDTDQNWIVRLKPRS